MEPQGVPTRAERYRQIVAVLAKHGLVAAGAALTKSDGSDRAQSRGEQMRLACEELGTTFIKLGQILSTRADLLPPEYREELVKLQDSVPPVETALIEAEIVNELGDTTLKLFENFERTPMASASIGQVHRATLLDGRDVVVKVQKPGVAALAERDLEILNQLAGSGEEYFPDLRGYDVQGLVEEFGDILRAELDYTREARNIVQFRKFFADDDGYVFPEVIWENSTGRVLTLTRVAGEKADGETMLPAPLREPAAQRVARFVLEPALVHGLFHADPHPGNIMIQPDGRIGVVDFGMVVRLSDDTRRRLGDVFMSMEKSDAQRLSDRLIDLAPPLRPIDRNALTRQLERLLERYMSASLGQVQMGTALSEMLEIVREFGLRLPAALAMFFKMVAMSEGMILEIAPDCSITDFLKPIARKVGLARLAPEEWAERAKDSAMDAAELSIELPRRADRVLADIERGNLRVWARLEDLEPMLNRLEVMVERANATMLAAACIVGITVLLAVYRPHGTQAVVAWVFWAAIVICVLWISRTVWATFIKRRQKKLSA
ncbi:MAG: ABC transporter [Candidatus Meridianibacter frigidus]|nr:MAG: ABC transporter [Candidatus Eremiobacteraeota bacterium]